MRGGRPDLVQRTGKHAQAGRAQIGAVHVTEINEQPLARKIAAAHDAAIGIDETQRLQRRRAQLLAGRRGGQAAQQRNGDSKAGKGKTWPNDSAAAGARRQGASAIPQPCVGGVPHLCGYRHDDNT